MPPLQRRKLFMSPSVREMDSALQHLQRYGTVFVADGVSSVRFRKTLVL